MRKSTAALALVAVLGLVSALPTHSQSASGVQLNFSGIAPGTSVVGLGAVHPLLNINMSDSNDVVAVSAEVLPAAYGGTLILDNGSRFEIANRCLGSAGAGFADLGSGDFHFTSKKHRYVFTFAEGLTVKKFSLRMADWSDFMPYGAPPDHRNAMQMFAYNAGEVIVDSDEIAFTTTANHASLTRESAEFGNSKVSGDACTATPGQPGNYTFVVEGQGITRVELHAKELASLDPHIAFTDLSFEIEDADGDGVGDGRDNCPAVSNPSQSDIDHDGIGDDCDPDKDGDDRSNETDNCPVNFNPTQADFDGDGIGDACEVGPVRPTTKDQCKDDGWKNWTPRFKNQGDCVSFTSNGK